MSLVGRDNYPDVFLLFYRTAGEHTYPDWTPAKLPLTDYPMPFILFAFDTVATLPQAVWLSFQAASGSARFALLFPYSTVSATPA